MALSDNITTTLTIIATIQAGQVSDVTALQSARSAAIMSLAMLKAEGPTQSNINVSIDGRNYDFQGATKALQDFITWTFEAIQMLQGAWMVKSRCI